VRNIGILLLSRKYECQCSSWSTVAKKFMRSL